MTLTTSHIVACILIALSLASWSFVRRHPVWLRPASSAVLFALLTATMVYAVGSPLALVLDGAVPSDRLWQQVIVASWWLLAARLVVELTRIAVTAKRFAGEGRLFSDLLAVVVYLSVCLTIASTVLGFPVGGLVATSGVIAIVLGLALQNTLADVFAGIAVGIERPYAIGDIVWLEGPIEGEVVQINWRSVQIRTSGDDIATVPNSVVARSRIINRSIPSTRRTDVVHLPCDAAVAPELVIELIQRAILLCPDIMETPRASVSLSEIGQRSNRYGITFCIAHSNLLVQTESTLRKEVLRQFRSAGIRTAYSAAAGPGSAAEAAAPTALATSSDEPASRRGLLDIALFHGLPDDCRTLLEDRLVRRVLEPGEILFAEGDDDTSLFIVAAGVLEVSRRVGNRVARVGRISIGDYIGEISLLTGTPRAAGVKALTRSVIFELHKDQVAPLLAERPELLHAFEASARRGQARLDRSVAASVGTAMPPSGPLLDRMRAFFHLHGI